LNKGLPLFGKQFKTISKGDEIFGIRPISISQTRASIGFNAPKNDIRDWE